MSPLDCPMHCTEFQEEIAVLLKNHPFKSARYHRLCPLVFFS